MMEYAPVAVAFSRPHKARRELDYIAEALAKGRLAGDGEFTRRCEDVLSGITGGLRVLLTTSCTSALEMAAILIDIGPGDEVILPSFTFTSTANAIVLRGATPVFVDIDPLTLNIDPGAIEAAVTPRTRAIFVVHYAGVVAEMHRILEIARRHDLVVVEDAAQAVGSTYRGRPAGSFGDLAAFSFHDSKNVTCGEGGCLVINRENLVERAEIIREKGTNRKNFMRGLVSKYDWIDLGSSFVLSELNAAMLLAQLEELDEINAERLAQWNRYHSELSPVSEGNAFELPAVPENRTHNGHLFRVLLPNERLQKSFIDYMRQRKIVAPFHYVPLHTAPAGVRYGRTAGPMDVTESIWKRLVRLPVHTNLGTHIETVIDAAVSWARQA